MLPLLSFSRFCVEIVKVTFFFIGLIKVIDFCLYQLFGEITAEFEHPKPDPIGKPSMSTEDTKSDEMIFPPCVPFESTALKKTSSQPEETCSTNDACNDLIKKESGNQQKKLEKNSTSSEFLTMKVDINGFAITGIVDTGANHTCLSKKTWEDIGKPKIRKKIFPSVDATFNKIPCDGECFVTVNGTEYKISVLSDSVPNQFNDNIFGTDIMKNMDIDFNEIFKKYHNDTKM
jgi:hypothetical protein